MHWKMLGDAVLRKRVYYKGCMYVCHADIHDLHDDLPLHVSSCINLYNIQDDCYLLPKHTSKLTLAHTLPTCLLEMNSSTTWL